MAQKYVHFLFCVLCILMLNEWLKRHNRCTRRISRTSPLFFILLKIPINTEMDASFFFFTVSQALRRNIFPLFVLYLASVSNLVLRIMSRHHRSTKTPDFDSMHNLTQLTAARIFSDSKREKKLLT